MNPEKPFCPSREAFEKAFRTDATTADREALIDHVRVCAPCRAKWDVLRELKREMASRGEAFDALAAASRKELEAGCRKPNAPSLSPFLEMRPRFAAAAGLVLVLALAATFLFGPLARRSAVYRDGEPAEIEMIAPHGVVDGFPTEFRWKPLPDADMYFFELIDDRLTTIIPETGNKDNSISLPVGYESRFQKGRTYIWSIKATNDAGLTIGTSQQSFTIR
jgi:hypothetical protein